MLLAGIFAGLQFHPSGWFCAVLFTAGLAGGIFFYLKGKDFDLDQIPKRVSRVFFSLALLAAGMGRVLLVNNIVNPGSIENFLDQRVSGLTGHIVSPPVISNSRTTLRIQIDKEQPGKDLPNEGRLLLVFYNTTDLDFHYGDRISIDGTVTRPPGSEQGFSYRTYLERNGITALINNPRTERLAGFSGNRLLAKIYQLREVLVSRVFRLFSKPESALMAGILLGDESKITSDIERDFQKTGTSHIIAISGANFSLLTFLLLNILNRLLPDYRAPLLLLPFIAFYTILVGANSAVVRAALMCALGILGSVLGRKGNGISNLSLSAAAMCLWKPVLIYDLGLQLSVTATLGILLFSEPLCNFCRGILGRIFPKIPEEALTALVSVLNDLCLMSISAQILTTFVTAQAFGQISLISLTANLLIAPFQPLIMLGGFAALLLSFVFYPLGAAAAWLIWGAPALTIRIVQRCADFKWGSVYCELPPYQAWVLIALIITIWTGRKMIINSVRRKNFLPYAAMLMLLSASLILTNAMNRLNRDTEIEIHQTASSLIMKIRSPENHYFVIGDNLTNYAAQDILEKQILPVPRPIEAAWLDLQENWMMNEFLRSNAAQKLPVLYVNGTNQKSASEYPKSLTDSDVFSVDNIKLQMVRSFLGKRCWKIESGKFSLLLPNGISPERIFETRDTDPREIDLVILGTQDDKAVWKEYTAIHNSRPLIHDFSASVDYTLHITENRLSYH